MAKQKMNKAEETINSLRIWKLNSELDAMTRFWENARSSLENDLGQTRTHSKEEAQMYAEALAGLEAVKATAAYKWRQEALMLEIRL